MSTVTLSNPHCAITSAENPEGIASQAFTTALPEAQTFLTLFAIGRVSPLPSVFSRISWRISFSWPLRSADGSLDAHFTHAHFAGGVHYRCPGIIRQGHPIFGAVGARFPLGISGDQHGIDAGDRLGRPDEIDIARDFTVEEIAGVDHLGIDVKSQHAVGELPVR